MCGYQISQVKTFITFFLLHLIACWHQISQLKTLLEFFELYQIACGTLIRQLNTLTVLLSGAVQLQVFQC
jgi:hypothetical protein